MLQANSPSRSAPTIRPLPFSVWKERRTSRRASSSSGFCSHCGKSAAICATFSRASSMNRWTNSESPLTAPMVGGTGARTGADDAAISRTLSITDGRGCAAGAASAGRLRSVTTLPAWSSDPRQFSALSSMLK